MVASDLNYFYKKHQARERRKKELMKEYNKKHIILDPFYKSLFYNKLKALKQIDSYNEIIIICDQYLANNNASPFVKAELWTEIGYCHKLIGNYHKAVEMFNKTIEIDDDHLDASEGLSQIYLKLEKYDLAIKWLKKSKETHEKALNEFKILGISQNESTPLKLELEKIKTVLNGLVREGMQ